MEERTQTDEALNAACLQASEELHQAEVLKAIELNYMICVQMAQENETLRQMVEQVRLNIQTIREENLELRSAFSGLDRQPKRKYAKRRTELEKKYVCPHHPCDGKYASKIALNNHLRKKHLRSESPN